MTGGGEIVSGAGTWGIAGEAVPAASGVVASPGREGGAGAAQRGDRRWLVSKAPIQRPRPAGSLAERKALRNRHVPAGQLPEGARVVMPPGPCVPFPGAGGTFPPARRPAARSPSEAAVATRTPSGASARTIGTVGIKCQERIVEGVSHRCWRTGPHPARRATFSRKREKDDGRSSLRASAGTDDDGIATCTDYFRYFFVWYVSASSMTSTMRSTCCRVRTRGGEMMKVS